MDRQLEFPDLDTMVAVASGRLSRVSKWAAVLTAAAIPSTVVECCKRGPHSARLAELWVRPEDAEEARAAIRASCEGEQLLW